MINNTILHILCEGQTEERFVKKVLAPFFQPYHIYPKPIVLVTSKKKHASGGVVSFAQVERDMGIMLKQFHDNSSDRHIFTSMFDYYALPSDFPGFYETSGFQNVRDRINYIERMIGNRFNNDRLIPYIQLHEFETLLFSDISRLVADYPDARSQITELKKATDLYDDPEMINDGPETAPSKRIIKAISHRYEYNKVQSGTNISLAIGLDTILERCRHFNEWINKILSLSSSI